MVDVDYADKLGEADKVWLASFLEEHYRGWRLKAETQVHPVGMIRQANAAHHRRRRGFEPVEFVSAEERGDGFNEDVLIDALDRKRRK